MHSKVTNNILYLEIIRETACHTSVEDNWKGSSVLFTNDTSPSLHKCPTSN